MVWRGIGAAMGVTRPMPVMTIAFGGADTGGTNQRRRSSNSCGRAGGWEQGGGGGSRRGARARRDRGWARPCDGRWGGVGESGMRDLLALDG